MRVGSDWNHYSYAYGEEGRVAEVRFDVERAVMPAPDTHQESIRIRVQGEPGDFEQQLRELLAEVDCWLVGVMRYAGLTAFVLQVEDTEGFARHAPRLEAHTETLEILRSRGWDFFEDRVCPSEADWRRITDREQLERLTSRGIDTSDTLPVIHAFYGADAALQELREQLAVDGFELSRHDGDRLELVRAHVVAEVSRVSVPLTRLARARSAAYDGWRVD